MDQPISRRDARSIVDARYNQPSSVRILGRVGTGAVNADPTTMPRWYEAVEHVTKTSAGPAATGATYEITRSLPGGEAHNTVEITEHEAQRRVTLESRHGPTPFRYRYTLQPRPHGATSTILDGRISGTGLPGPIGHLDPLATRLFTHGMRRNLTELKRLIESTT